MASHEGIQIDGRWVCQAEHCPHRIIGKGCYGCKLGKVSLSCDKTDCRWNVEVPGSDNRCLCMDVHLDADGRCLGYEKRGIRR